MGGRNAFFRIEIRDNQAFLKIFPAQGEGKVLDLKEVEEYLRGKNFDVYDRKILKHAVTGTTNIKEVLLGPWSGNYINEEMKVFASSDNMLVFCRFYPPSNEGKLITKQEFIDEINANKISFGIIKENLQILLSKRGYCQDYLIAKGVPPKQGRNGEVEFFFNTFMNTKPKKNEDGSVDYRSLDLISHVEKGQLLARLKKEVQGVPGKNILGQVIPAAQVKPAKLLYANNITISEDQTELYAAVSGHASYVEGKIFVSNIFDVPADVDNSTGNISYDGSVVVKGNIKAGFTVEAEGDIIVNGVIEGAYVRSKGNIIVKHGIRGMSKGKIEAEGDIIAKNIENAFVSAGGSIQTSAILHSTVLAAIEVKVQGKKGFVTGGVIRAGKVVQASTIGSDMGALTKIEVGVDPKLKERYSLLRKANLEAEKEMEQIHPILTNFNEQIRKKATILPAKQKQIQEFAAVYKQKKELVEQNTAEMEVLYQEIQQNSGAKIQVRGTIFPGTEITISDQHLFIKEQRSFAQYLIEKGEIVVKPL